MMVHYSASLVQMHLSARDLGPELKGKGPNYNWGYSERRIKRLQATGSRQATSSLRLLGDAVQPKNEKAAANRGFSMLDSPWEIGAGEAIRTLDPNLARLGTVFSADFHNKPKMPRTPENHCVALAGDLR